MVDYLKYKGNQMVDYQPYSTNQMVDYLQKVNQMDGLAGLQLQHLVDYARCNYSEIINYLALQLQG
jgi:ABC-type phosphate/phosphonate transport system ATPase subunit